jgi:hypothetical protein
LVRTKTYLHLVVSTIAPQLQPHYHSSSNGLITTSLIQSAQEDEGAISSILFHASLHADVQNSQKNTWSPSTLYYHGRTVRILQERLRSRDHVASDSSICMVAFLAASGNITGDIAPTRSHWTALRTMLDMRGGWEVLGWNGALAHIIQM